MKSGTGVSGTGASVAALTGGWVGNLAGRSITAALRAITIADICRLPLELWRSAAPPALEPLPAYRIASASGGDPHIRKPDGCLPSPACETQCLGLIPPCPRYLFVCPKVPPALCPGVVPLRSFTLALALAAAVSVAGVLLSTPA